jgi:lipid-binding SYLF domain-containing protein
MLDLGFLMHHRTEDLMQTRTFLLKATASLAFAAFALTGCTTTTKPAAETPSTSSARTEIDSGVDGTLSRLYSQVNGSRELVAKADGVLVFPRVIAAGLVVGGEYGKGALRVKGRTEGYYRITSVSVGFQAGAQSKSIIVLFMTRDALEKFRSKPGWTVGVDASVAVLKVGANGALDTASATEPVQVIVLTNVGLMANLSLEGTKISRRDG